jgi:hypothetical protein
MTASRKSRDVTVHYGTCPQCGVAGQLFRVGYCAHCTIAHQETQIKALKQLIPSETASIPRRSLQAMRWSADIFGWSARDQQERAMRFAEEAAELAHAAGLKHDVFEAIVDRVYNRPPGDVHVEVGQALLTLEMLGEVLGVVADQAATREFNRVQAIPKEEWERRHQAKVDMGIAK